MASLGPKNNTFTQGVCGVLQTGNFHVPNGKAILTEDSSGNTWGVIDGKTQFIRKGQQFVLKNTADTAGAALAVANPEGVAIIIVRLLLYVTTVSAAACTLSAGVAANATTLNGGLITGQDVRSATGVFDNISNAIAASGGKTFQLWGSTQFLTVSTASGAIAGLVANAYIEYIVP